ncbi:MAG: alpha-L-fucosidase [Proteobacteria bacterium]|nr:alpha-L-fucosidase [Pseudomonadota bacterium]
MNKILLALALTSIVALATPAPIDPNVFKRSIRVACVGDSITQGAKLAKGMTYPEQLQKILGSAWIVKNFGKSGRTLLKQGDHPYWNESIYQDALQFAPDVVIIKLGTNDTKPQNWKHIADFKNDYRALVESFSSLQTKPHIYICTPCPVVGSGAFDISNVGIEEEVAWVKELGAELNVGLIDMNAAFAGKSKLLPDKVHPNEEGAALLASAAYSALTGKEPPVPHTPDRLGWWREARFGMFIHWGVYSALAGEWKGQRVEGYAEHIQRIAKIKRETYLEEVVKPFNPTSFNADEWVRTAKETGMGYIIITAMHHDGVAMFDSKADDYNIVKTSKFGRDPLRELKAACDKHGIKLGFYYSHAIDWSLSGDPRFPEPNGPERRKACVERKALPQMLELIRNYQPAILWGDTPHQNPQELNLQILDALRNEDPNLILNGRIAGSAYGDYHTTSDRPAEFGLMTAPEERDWEAIPTTNESYGYHAHDKSHKPTGHFIQLLAKAAARGGNLLLNIGPKGDGTFAAEDRHILDAIAKWWKVNGESIRNTERTPLAPQSWGESTLKGNTLYIHVFEWPKKGKLLVGGLNAEVAKSSLLADPQKQLPIERIGPDLEITLPESAPDAADSVIMLKCKNRPTGDMAQVLQTNTANKLSVFTAELLGPVDRKGWSLGKGTSITSHAKGWKTKDCAVRWKTRLTRPGKFQVTVHYDAPEADKAKIETDGGAIAAKSQQTFGGTFTVTIGSQKLQGEVHEQGMDIALDLGPIDLEPGDLEIKIQANEITGKELMLLKNITLLPL